MPAMTIHDRTATGRHVESFSLDLPEHISVRDLIRTRVRDEVARHNLRPAEAFRGLVAPTDAELSSAGYRLRKPRRIEWERQAEIAVDAFGRNGFFVLVNGRQALELDQEIDLTGETDIAFVKLVPLVGG